MGYGARRLTDQDQVLHKKAKGKRFSCANIWVDYLKVRIQIIVLSKTEGARNELLTGTEEFLFD